MRVKPAAVDDVERMADLAAEKRAAQALWDPEFWRVAERARELHPLYLRFLLTRPDTVARVSLDSNERIDGFVIARCASACLIDDFTVESPELWPSVGRALLDDAVAGARAHEPRDLVVVCAARDEAKAAMLERAGLEVSCSFLRRRLPGASSEPSRDVRLARDSDSPAIEALSRSRVALHHGMPVTDADLCLVLEEGGNVTGYARAKTGFPVPPVYAPGGTPCFVPELVGAGALLAELEARAAAKGDTQLLIACAASEADLRGLLDARGYGHPVDWYHRALR